MRYLITLIIAVFFTVTFPVFSQDSLVREKLKKLEKIEGEDFRQGIRLIYDSLKYLSDFQAKMNVADHVFALTLKKDDIAHIHSLLFRAMHSGKNESGLFEQAFMLAEKYHLPDDINNVEFSRSQFYLERKQFDSAMIYLLSYLDRTHDHKEGEGYLNILNLLGDIYFEAGIYNRAVEIYSGIFQQYERDENWNFFRPYVMMNNLGQIALNTGNLQLANQWFTRSIQIAENQLHTPYRFNTMAYTKIKLAETALEYDSLDLAERLLNEVACYPSEEIYNDVRQERMYCSARLLLKQGELDKAQQVARKLLPGASAQFGHYRFVPEIFRMMAAISVRQNNLPVALDYMNKYNMMQDSLDAQMHLAGSMIILAEYNQEISRIELQRSRNRVLMLISGLAIVLIVLFVILLLYRKLYRSKLALVKKTLEKEQQVEMPALVNENCKPEELPDENERNQQANLISNLKVLMESQKPYLNPGLTIVEVAQLLATNRTYLSKAINGQLKTTFPNFINEYRIRESIRLITTGYTLTHTQEALANQSGFANRNVFINAFKKYTGVVPSFFIANYKKWNNKDNRFHDDD